MKLIFVRHGQSEANLNKVYAGQNMSPLTEKGIEQARETGQFLVGRNISKIISSDQTRAVQTAEEIRNIINSDLEIEKWEELREVDCGEKTGSPYTN